MYDILCFSAFCLLLPVQSISWFPRSENITVTRGEDVHFRCPLSSNISTKDYIIQWKKARNSDDHLVVSINGKIPKSLSTLYRTEFTDQTSSLQVFHVDRADSTTYICETFETQTILCQYNLVVLIKPEAPLLTLDRDDLDESQAVTLTCSSVNGNPPPHYTWSRNGTLLISADGQVSDRENGSTLTWNVTRFDDQMTYQCEIWNPALVQPVRLERQLHVKYQPYVKILEETTILSNERDRIKRLVGIEQYEQNFTCQFQANPPPTSIYWITNGTTIVSREKSMYLPRLTLEHSGVYSCIVENILGKANQSVYLDVQFSPRVRALQSQIVANRSDAVLLRCSIDSNPSPYEIIWLKNQTQLLRQTQLTDLRLERVERNHSGLYTCMAFNRFHNNITSNGSSAIELIVQSRPVIETTYSKLAAEIDQAVTLTCRVSGQPMPNIYWKLQERIISCDEITDETCYLRLPRMRPTDFGSYRCIAENLLGREEWVYTIVSRGKPETPTDIEVSDMTASSFQIRFAPSFDGGNGSQRFFVQVTDLHNSSAMKQELPHNTYQYTIKGLNESTVYLVLLQAMNTYGESPWSIPVTVQTTESILTSDDLPQLHVISYNSKDASLHFDYLPVSSRSKLMNEEQLCLNVRHSTDGKLYQTGNSCLPISHRRTPWKIQQDLLYLKLSICSKKRKDICGPEIEMKEEMRSQTSAAMIIGIVVTCSFLILVISLTLGVFCCRTTRKARSTTNGSRFDIHDLDRDMKTIISEPRFQNPYLLYSHSNRRSSLHDFALDEYQQRPQATSFAQSNHSKVDFDGNFSYATTAAANRTTIDPPSYRRSDASRSDSNPSSESSCVTQHTHLVFAPVEKNHSVYISHYGFPPIVSSSANRQSSSYDQTSSSSEYSTPDRMKKLSYEMVV